MEEDALVLEQGLAGDGEVRGEGGAEGGFVQVGVDGLASAQDLAELGIAGRNPLEDEVAGGEPGAEGGDAIERDLTAEQQVMDDGEHEDGVEVAFAAREEGGGLAVVPADGGGGVGEIDAEREDGEVFVCGGGSEGGSEPVYGLEVGVDGDDGGSARAARRE